MDDPMQQAKFLIALMRDTQENAFRMEWEGSKIPRGATINGIEIGWTQHGRITWPCIWDGRSGPIALQYRVRSYPTVVLIDGQGKISALSLSDKTHLREQVGKLLQTPAGH